MKTILTPVQENPYHLRKESGGSTGSSSSPGWGRGCWEAGRTAAEEAGSRAAWGMARSATEGRRLQSAHLGRDGLAGFSDYFGQVTLLWS